MPIKLMGVSNLIGSFFLSSLSSSNQDVEISWPRDETVTIFSVPLWDVSNFIITFPRRRYFPVVRLNFYGDYMELARLRYVEFSLPRYETGTVFSAPLWDFYCFKFFPSLGRYRFP